MEKGTETQQVEAQAQPSQSQAVPQQGLHDYASKLFAGLNGNESVLEDLSRSLTSQNGAQATSQQQSAQPAAQAAAPASTTESSSATPPATEASASASNEDATSADTKADAPAEVNPILAKYKSNTPAAPVENVDQIFGAVSKTYGVEVKDLNGLKKFLDSSVPKWREASQKMPEIQARAEQLENIFTSLPPEIFSQVDAWAKGEDWTAAVGSMPKIDYNKPFDKQDKKQLLEVYYPGKFADVDPENLGDKEETYKLALDSIEAKFSKGKQEYDGERAKIYQAQQQKLSAVKASVASSVSHLQQAFPGVENNAWGKDVQKILTSGDINSVFKNADGTYKQEAAEMLMYAKYGKQTIQDMMERAANEATTKTNEEIILRGADRPTATGKGTEISVDTQKQLKELEQLGKGLDGNKTFK